MVHIMVLDYATNSGRNGYAGQNDGKFAQMGDILSPLTYL